MTPFLSALKPFHPKVCLNAHLHFTTGAPHAAAPIPPSPKGDGPLGVSIVEGMIRRLADELGLTPIERPQRRQAGDLEPVTVTREGKEQANDT